MRQKDSRIILPFVFLAVAVFSALLFSQQINQVSSVINVEVPVRVYAGADFVDNLTLQDFELFEDGNLQQIEAIYRIKKLNILKEDGAKKYSPQTMRQFVLLFEMTDPLPRVDRAIDYFFDAVIQPNDELAVITPKKTYRFRGDALTKMPKKRIADELKGKLRADIQIASGEYKNILNHLKDIWGGDADLNEKLTAYSQILSNLESIRRIDQNNLLAFAEALKKTVGQKFVYLFYQRELVPTLSLQAIQILAMENQDRVDILAGISELFENFKRDVSFNVDKVKKAYSDSSITVHLLFLTETRLDMGMGPLGMTEASDDIYSAFNEVAAATGGFVYSSANPMMSFQNAVEASENYYLIYYTPKDYKADGKFRKLKVRVKTGNFKVSHRVGYFAN